MRIFPAGLGTLCVLGAAAALGASPTATDTLPPQSTVCGDIINDVNQGLWYWSAREAYDCLTSVPFSAAVARRFLDYFNTTMQFQSTLAYLREPPRGYQQPAVDVEQRLEQIKTRIDSGYYGNEYDFEADIMALVMAMHDTHVSLYAGAMSAFTFGSGFDLVTASVDGIQAPKVYVRNDIYLRRDHGEEISPIATINGQDAVEFLVQFAAQNSHGMVEPHADWNQIMYSPVLDILESNSVFFQGATFYPGDDLALIFENGVQWSNKWLSVYTVPTFTGPLSTGTDFFNLFVLGRYPSNYADVPLPPVFDLTREPDSPSVAAPNWYVLTRGAYPNDPVVTQENLRPGSFGGVVTGYILKDMSMGVLSIPTFVQAANDLDAFLGAVDDFIRNATSSNVSRVLIDLRGNMGGLTVLAYSIFSVFFPNIEPFAGSRRRSHDMANVVGQAKTQTWANLPDMSPRKVALAGDEWVVMDLINAATGHTFESWAQYYGPLSENNDGFSLVEQYDFTNPIFQKENFDGWVNQAYLHGADSKASTPFQASQIAILTDGQCASACTLFLEMMTHQAGVRTIVVGGQPTAGPMQAGAGTRGARDYSTTLLDEDFADAIAFSNGDATAHLPPIDPNTGKRDSGMSVSQFGFNLRDQVRGQGDGPTVPLQFQYLAADCRIYYTLDNVINAATLWHDAATAIWLNSSRCVPESMGYAAASNVTAATPPAANATHPAAPASPTSILAYGGEITPSEANLAGGLTDGYPHVSPPRVRLCDSYSPCDHGYSCASATYPCQQSELELVTQNICMPSCDGTNQLCPMWMLCDLSHAITAESRVLAGSPLGQNQSPNLRIGVCKPRYGAAFENIGCGPSPPSVGHAVAQHYGGTQWPSPRAPRRQKKMIR